MSDLLSQIGAHLLASLVPKCYCYCYSPHSITLSRTVGERMEVYRLGCHPFVLPRLALAPVLGPRPCQELCLCGLTSPVSHKLVLVAEEKSDKDCCKGWGPLFIPAARLA